MVVQSVQHPVLEKGVRYWVVAAATQRLGRVGA